MKITIEDEYLFTYMEQLGYQKRNKGKWIQSVEDVGSGFPETIYKCSCCGREQKEKTLYCCDCGAELEIKK